MISATWVQEDPVDEPELLVRLTKDQAWTVVRALDSARQDKFAFLTVSDDVVTDMIAAFVDVLDKR